MNTPAHISLVGKDSTVQLQPSAAIDKQAQSDNHAGMSQMTREEMDAKMDARDARADARMARFEERIDLSLKQLEVTTAAFRQDMKDMRLEFREDVANVRQEFRSMKSTVIVTAISSVIAIVGGIAAFNAALLSNMVSSYDSGRETAKLTVEASQQTLESIKKNTELVERLEAMSAENLKAAQAMERAAQAGQKR